MQKFEFDGCFAPSSVSRRLDRITATLVQKDGTWNGSGTSQIDALPVEISLTRRGPANSFVLAGELRARATSIRFNQKDSSFNEDTPGGDSAVPGTEVYPATSAEITPNAISIVARPGELAGVIGLLRKYRAEIKDNTALAECDNLRSNTLSVSADVDPLRARPLVEEAQKLKGVVRAGWISGMMNLDDAARAAPGAFMANGAVEAGKLLPLLADTIGAAIAQKAEGAPVQDARTGVYKLKFAGPGAAIRELGIVETTEVELLFALEGLQAKGPVIVYLGDTDRGFADSQNGLAFSAASRGGEGGRSGGDTGFRQTIQRAMARALNGEYRDSDAKAWKKPGQ